MSILIFKIFFILISHINSEELIFVSTHFRHGARAPIKLGPFYYDLAKEKWTNPGELTAIGQRMHYILGLRNRLRYIRNHHFLSEKFNPHEILVYSSAFNRTIVSALAQLQGLYPSDDNLGLTLNEDQEKKAIPEVDYHDTYIMDKIDKIKGYSIPNMMTLIPVRMINDNERKIAIYDIGECEKKRDEIKEKNRKTLPIIINMEINFNEKYKKILNEFYGTDETYDFYFMNKFCDAIISNTAEGRNLTEFKKTGIEVNETREYCYEVQKVNYQELILGDDEHILAPLEASKLMREIIHYMKQRIDIDINQENVEEEYLDYSRPNMVMISGHDSTISCNEMFIINSLGYGDDYFRMAKYASQLALEVTRPEAPPEQVKKMTYKDYTLNYYMNDELLLQLPVDEFIKKIEAKLWTDEQIDKFCGFKNSDNKRNSALSSTQIMIAIILITLVIIFLTSTLILSVKFFLLSKKHKKTELQISMIERNSLNETA